MKILQNYLNKTLHYPGIQTEPDKNVGFIVVIPCYNEPFLFDTLESLRACASPDSQVEVIVVLNAPFEAHNRGLEQNDKSRNEFRGWIKEVNDSWIRFLLLDLGIVHDKHAGVGYARKAGMDESIYRFNKTGRDDGVIISLDADAVCDNNYFTEIEKLYRQEKDLNGCHNYFEHILQGNEDKLIYEAAAHYELYLRQYTESLRWSKFPYAFHTIGSCFTVSCRAYAKQGGMNKRKGGEDFYFLQKIFSLGKYKELNTIRISLSPRPSDRVPFGTGKEIIKYINGKKKHAYNFQAFKELKRLFDSLDDIHASQNNKGYCMPFVSPCLKSFLDKSNFQERINEIFSNASTYEAFRKRFFNWFNAFRILKYLNHAHGIYYDKVDLLEVSKELLNETGYGWEGDDVFALLHAYREIQRNRIFKI